MIKKLFAKPKNKVIAAILTAAIAVSSVAIALGSAFAAPVPENWSAPALPETGYAGEIINIGSTAYFSATSAREVGRYVSNNKMSAVYDNDEAEFAITPISAGESALVYGNRTSGETFIQDFWMRNNANVAGYSFPLSRNVTMNRGETKAFSDFFTATNGSGTAVTLNWTAAGEAAAAKIQGANIVAEAFNGMAFFVADFEDVWGEKHFLYLTVQVGTGTGLEVVEVDGEFYVLIDEDEDVYVKTDNNGKPVNPPTYWKNIIPPPATQVWPDGDGWTTNDPDDHVCFGDIIKIGDDYYIKTAIEDGDGNELYLKLDENGKVAPHKYYKLVAGEMIEVDLGDCPKCEILRIQLEAAEARIIELEGEITALLSEIESLRDQIETLLETITEKDIEIETLTERITELETLIETLEGRIEYLETLVETLETEIITLTETITELRIEILDQGDEIADLLAHIEYLESLLEIANERILTLEGQIETLTETITELNEQITTLLADLADKDAEIIVLEGQITTLTNTVNTLTDTITTLEGQITTLTADLTAALARIAELEDELALYKPCQVCENHECTKDTCVDCAVHECTKDTCVDCAVHTCTKDTCVDCAAHECAPCTLHHANIVKDSDDRFYVGTNKKYNNQDVYILMDTEGKNVVIPLEYYVNVIPGPRTQVYPNGKGGFDIEEPCEHCGKYPCECDDGKIIMPDGDGLEIHASSTHKTVFTVNDRFSAAGLKLHVFYDDGTDEVVDGPFTTSPSNNAVLRNSGNQTVTVIYKGESITYTIRVRNPVVLPPTQGAQGGIDGIVLGEDKTGDTTSNWLAIATKKVDDEDYLLIVRAKIIGSSQTNASYPAGPAKTLVTNWYDVTAPSKLKSFAVPTDADSRCGSTNFLIGDARGFSSPTPTSTVGVYSFILSSQEAGNYLSTRENLGGYGEKASPTPAPGNWAKMGSGGAAAGDMNSVRSWLRAPHDGPGGALVFNTSGNINVGSVPTNTEGVRPALWVSADILNP